MLAGHALALEQSERDAKSREVRLGLVMYGGVSLAVYINGVAQEFFNAVRGRGVYRLIKALTDSDVVVDVISGTSAGGINGILLANALCAQKELEPLASLWREHAGITDVLRRPDGDLDRATSLLDSERYYAQLTDGFKRLNESPTLAPPRSDEDPSPLAELDLFVTGTDVDGRRYTEFDDQGHPIDVKDHRAVFVLKHRQGRKTPFAPGPESAPPAATYAALAKLAGITSCFPAAFTPVRVSLPGSDRADGAVESAADALLRWWGYLDGDRDAVFIDGGVLDNKPFSYTARAVFSRSALGEVDRKMFFVEPDPERFPPLAHASQPNIVKTVLASLISIPRYESIADDLRALTDRNRRLERYRRMVAELQPYTAAVPATHDESPHPVLAVDGATAELYRRSRFVALGDRIIEGVFKTGGRPDLVEPDQRGRAAELVRFFDELVAERPDLLVDFDLHYRMRRLYRIVYAVYDLLYEPARSGAAPADGRPEVGAVTVEQARAYRELWEAFNHQIELYEILLAAVERLIDEAPIGWDKLDGVTVWQVVYRALQRLLAADSPPAQGLPPRFASGQPWLPPPTLEHFRAALATLSAEVCQRIEAGPTAFAADSPPSFESLLRRLDGREQAILAALLPDERDRIRRAYAEFEELDAHVYPLELVGDLREKDVIETVRISPRDADKGFSRLDLAEKVSGDALYHFGAFFKRSWRSNDVLWGRLDALCELTQELLPRERIARIAASDEWRARVRDRFFEPPAGPADEPTWRPELDPAALFPGAGAPTHQRCRAWLRALLGEDDAARARALDADEFGGMVELLIEAAQLQVLYTEVPNVVADALHEQSTWNSFQVVRESDLPPGTAPPGAPAEGPPDNLPPWFFRQGSKWLDPFVATTGAAERMVEAMRRYAEVAGPPQRPTFTPLGIFFRDGYRVGSEELTRDIPTRVLLEILATALLVARSCVLVAFGPERAAAIRRNPLYRFGLDLPLRAFHAAVVFGPRTPAGVLALTGALLAAAAMLLAIGVVFSRALVFTAQGLSVLGLLLFYGAPLVILFGLMLLAVWAGSRRARASRPTAARTRNRPRPAGR
ncbi:MAG TPA: patatin-like protein [Chloroflexota bacterium]